MLYLMNASVQSVGNFCDHCGGRIIYLFNCLACFWRPIKYVCVMIALIYFYIHLGLMVNLPKNKCVWCKCILMKQHIAIMNASIPTPFCSALAPKMAESQWLILEPCELFHERIVRIFLLLKHLNKMGYWNDDVSLFHWRT